MSKPARIGPFSSLSGISKCGYPLQAYREPFIRAIKTFARWAGIKKFSPDTCAKLHLKDDYFIFCFSALISDPLSIMTGRSEEGRARKERYVELLKNPALASKADLFRGLQTFMGNFTCYMPGGLYRVWYQSNPDFFLDKKRIFDLIDLQLSQKGMLARESKLRAAAESEEPVIIASAIKSGAVPAENFDKRLAYFKFCLNIFELLVERHKIDPKTLWH